MIRFYLALNAEPPSPHCMASAHYFTVLSILVDSGDFMRNLIKLLSMMTKGIK